jgi:hypothetical protein
MKLFRGHFVFIGLVLFSNSGCKSLQDNNGKDLDSLKTSSESRMQSNSLPYGCQMDHGSFSMFRPITLTPSLDNYLAKFSYDREVAKLRCFKDQESNIGCFMKAIGDILQVETLKLNDQNFVFAGSVKGKFGRSDFVENISCASKPMLEFPSGQPINCVLTDGRNEVFDLTFYSDVDSQRNFVASTRYNFGNAVLDCEDTNSSDVINCSGSWWHLQEQEVKIHLRSDNEQYLGKLSGHYGGEELNFDLACQVTP